MYILCMQRVSRQASLIIGLILICESHMTPSCIQWWIRAQSYCQARKEAAPENLPRHQEYPWLLQDDAEITAFILKECSPFPAAHQEECVSLYSIFIKSTEKRQRLCLSEAGCHGRGVRGQISVTQQRLSHLNCWHKLIRHFSEHDSAFFLASMENPTWEKGVHSVTPQTLWSALHPMTGGASGIIPCVHFKQNKRE